MDNSNRDDNIDDTSIAIIGMAGRFPGAKNIAEFWQNLKAGVESIRFFSDQELIDSGIDPAVLKDTHYVKAKGALDNVADFDAAFFDMGPKEAEITDPQQRLFLECAWEALENAGYDPKRYSGSIGIYGGMGGGFDTYLSHNLYDNHELRKVVSDFQISLNNLNDFICTRVSYKFNLSGPSVTVQTACSTSLVAVVMAYQSLLDYQCDIALAGAAAISLPEKSGYFYKEGMIYSPDGHCRTFDSKAKGTVDGNGAGIVVLKRLTDALTDGDSIYAVIRGAALNNDGALKISYTAPSLDAQSRVIAEALVIADISPESISYVEAHGTGTPLGDPIEVGALTQAFRAQTNQKGYCAIGSVKTNVGHLDAAAGVTGLIKTALALKHQLIPPSLHFETPNPKLDLGNSPFYVNTKLSKWQTQGFPRRAGINAFGVGGTNAHVILEEAPIPHIDKPKSKWPWQLLLLSAKTNTALETATTQLVEHFKQHPDLNLADVAYTYQIGRRFFKHRRMLVCQTLDDTIKTLETGDAKRILTQTIKSDEEPHMVFMFSGQGTQYVNMGLELYQIEPLFREQIDQCAEFLKPHLGLDLRTILYPKSTTQTEKATQQLKQTAITQPTLFIIEYALAQLWKSWGIQPKAMIGHSIGEYVAACLAGVLTLEEALLLVATRGRLIQSVPAGAMLAVPLAEPEIRPLLNPNLDLAALNVSSQCVVSGTFEAVAALSAQLAEQGIECQRVQTSHAFHSEMMAPILTSFLEQVEKIVLKPPKIPFISNVTGTWISHAEATDPNYWIKHLRQTVRFAAGLQNIFKEPSSLLLEVGPGHTLSTFAKRHPDNSGHRVLTSLPHPKDELSDSAFLLKTIGELWLAGITLNWSRFYQDEQRYRLPLPTYPFERQRYWIEAQKSLKEEKYSEEQKPVSLAFNEKVQLSTLKTLKRKEDIADWFYIPSWQYTMLPPPSETQIASQQCYLVFLDKHGLGSNIVQGLKEKGHDVISVKVGTAFLSSKQEHSYTLNPEQPEDYDALFKTLISLKQIPKTIVHLWNITRQDDRQLNFEQLEEYQNLGFYSLLFLTQALSKQNMTQTIQIDIVSNHLQQVTGNEVLCPAKATLLGPCRVIPQEYPNIKCRSIDVLFSQSGTAQDKTLVDQVISEILVKQSDDIIAYRNHERWVQTFKPIRLDETSTDKLLALLRENGVYLITGGLGGIGLVLAEYLAKTLSAKLILTTHSFFPEPNLWTEWLNTHDDQDRVSRQIRKVQMIQAMGAEVLIVNADVTHFDQMSGAMTQSLTQFDQIHGVIHAAGIFPGGSIALKTPAMVESILAPKVKGTLILDAVLKEQQLDFMILCSSITAIVGEVGMLDHCAANAFLDAFAHHRTSQSDKFTLSINWETWKEVGIAAEAAQQQVRKTSQEISSKKSETIAHPLFDNCILLEEEPDKAIYISHFSVQKHWVLSEHKVMGNFILPGTAYLEIARAAFEHYAPHEGLIEIRDFYFLAPLIVDTNQEKEVRTILQQGEKGVEFVISSQSHLGILQEHAKGQIVSIEAEPLLECNLKELDEKCPTLGQFTIQQGFELGGRWNNLKQLKFGQNQVLALLELPKAFSAEIKEYKLHPALLDVATSFTEVKDDNTYLPFSYQKLRLKGPIPAKIYSHLIYKDHSASNTLIFNVNIMDEEGRSLLEVENYTLRRVDTDFEKAEQHALIAGRDNFNLEISSPGILESLTFKAATHNKPTQDEVEIEVTAISLNFKEVLLALGLLSTNTPIQFGLECVGKILALGENVTEFQVGDEVMALDTNGGCFSAYKTFPIAYVVPKPKHLSLEEAATIPGAFMTAYYALVYLGRLRQGERILIHAATGGVGLAAVQIAKMIGAEIFATAGTPEKRAFLNSLGIEYVMNSRTVTFADEVMKHTAGEGVDVILNSLGGGEFISKNVSLLSRFGRLLELGKRDIHQNTSLDLLPFDNSLSFFAIDVQNNPHFISLFSELIQHFKDGKLSPLPYQVFPITEVVDAFKYMAGAKHIGRIVVSLINNKPSQLKELYSDTALSVYNDTVDAIGDKTVPSDNLSQKNLDLKEGLLSVEGIEVFKRILCQKYSQIVVSTRDLAARLEKNTLSLSLKDSAATDLPKSAHSRPQLNNAYVAPRNELERMITEIWEKFFNIDTVGIFDGFFELGGDSLMAVQLVSELRRRTQQELSAHSLLEKTTPAALAELIQAKPIDDDNTQTQKQVLPTL